jgi:hypothetical protein
VLQSATAGSARAGTGLRQRTSQEQPLPWKLQGHAQRRVNKHRGPHASTAAPASQHRPSKSSVAPAPQHLPYLLTTRLAQHWPELSFTPLSHPEDVSTSQRTPVQPSWQMHLLSSLEHAPLPLQPLTLGSAHRPPERGHACEVGGLVAAGHLASGTAPWVTTFLQAAQRAFLDASSFVKHEPLPVLTRSQMRNVLHPARFAAARQLAASTANDDATIRCTARSSASAQGAQRPGGIAEHLQATSRVFLPPLWTTAPASSLQTCLPLPASLAHGAASHATFACSHFWRLHGRETSSFARPMHAAPLLSTTVSEL